MMATDSEDEGKQWLIVYCDSDVSYCLIDETEAVYDGETIRLGDVVTFMFKTRDGKMKQFQGTVEDIGEDKDYDNMCRKLDKLEAALNKPKRQPSFHADQERRGRGAAMKNVLDSLKPKPRPRTSSSQSQPAERSVPINSKQKKQVQNNKPLPPRANIRRTRNPRDTAAKSKGLSSLPNATNDFNDDADDNSEGQVSPLLQRRNKNNDTLDKSQTYHDMDDDDSGSSTTAYSPPSSPSHTREALATKRKDADKGRNSDLLALKRLRTHQRKGDSLSTAVKDKSIDLQSSEGHPTSQAVAQTHDKGSAEKQAGGGPSSQNGNDSDDNITNGSMDNGSKKRQSIYNGMVEYADSEPDNEDSGGDTPSKGKSKKGKKGKETPVEQERPASPEFEMRRYPDKDSAPQLVKVRGTGPLQENYFFITVDANNAAKLQGNATKFAKTLLHGAFSDEALYRCSLKGGEFRAAGKGNFTRKPALDQGIVAVIVDVTEKRQATKKWTPVCSTREIMSAMRQKIQDLRPSLKKKFAATDAST